MQNNTFNKGVFTSMKQFELRKNEKGKSTLGTGSFGTVSLYENQSQLYAVKTILGSNLQTPYEKDGIDREIKNHQKCTHPNIIKLYDSFTENKNIYMILEYAPNGNLYSYIHRNKIDEKQAAKFFVQTAKSLQYLHDMNVFHRDIKPENLLLDSKLNIKLCDFGWCAEKIHLKRRTFCGTYEYMAPEIVSDTPYDYTIDIWSLGILLYELLHGYSPFKGKEYKDIANKIKEGKIYFTSSVSEDAQELISQILVKDGKNRPSINQILKSAFIQRTFQSQYNLEIKSPRMHLQTQSQENQFSYNSPTMNKCFNRKPVIEPFKEITSYLANTEKKRAVKGKSKTGLFQQNENIFGKKLFDHKSPFKNLDTIV